MIQYKHGFELSPSLTLFLYKSVMLTSRKFSFFNFFLILFNAKSLQKSYLIHSCLKQKCMLEVEEENVLHACAKYFYIPFS